MKFLGKILGFFLNALALLTTQIFIINFLPYPFNQINFIFAVLLAFITAGETKKVFWLALAISYFLDLFSGSPFGISIAATLISLFFIKWLQSNIFTNRSIYMVFLSAIIGITLYRFLFITFLTINNYFTNQATWYYGQISAEALWEISLSAAMLLVFYILRYKIFGKNVNARTKKKDIYG